MKEKKKTIFFRPEEKADFFFLFVWSKTFPPAERWTSNTFSSNINVNRVQAGKTRCKQTNVPVRETGPRRPRLFDKTRRTAEEGDEGGIGPRDASSTVLPEVNLSLPSLSQFPFLHSVSFVSV